MPSNGDSNHGCIGTESLTALHISFSRERLLLAPSQSRARTLNPYWLNTSIALVTTECKNLVSIVEDMVKYGPMTSKSDDRSLHRNWTTYVVFWHFSSVSRPWYTSWRLAKSSEDMANPIMAELALFHTTLDWTYARYKTTMEVLET